MKKMMILFGVVVIVVLMFVAISSIAQYYKIPVNNDISLNIENIYMQPLSEWGTKNIIESGTYTGKNVDQNIINQMKIDPYRYKELIIEYTISNKSNSIPIYDVWFEPVYTNEINTRITVYDRRCFREKPICIYENDTEQLEQHILIDTNGLSDEEIVEIAQKGQINLSFFTGRMGVNKGEEIDHPKRQLEIIEFF